jgi:hypothetical protein
LPSRSNDARRFRRIESTAWPSIPTSSGKRGCNSTSKSPCSIAAAAAAILLLRQAGIGWLRERARYLGALGALAAIAVVFVTAAQASPALPLALESLVALYGMLMLVLVIFRLADPPDVSFLESMAGAATRERVEDIDRAAGAWLGLAAVLGIVVGAFVAIRDERRSPAGRPTDLSGVPVSSPPEVESLPAPHPEAGS